MPLHQLSEMIFYEGKRAKFDEQDTKPGL